MGYDRLIIRKEMFKAEEKIILFLSIFPLEYMKTGHYRVKSLGMHSVQHNVTSEFPLSIIVSFCIEYKITFFTDEVRFPPNEIYDLIYKVYYKVKPIKIRKLA